VGGSGRNGPLSTIRSRLRPAIAIAIFGALIGGRGAAQPYASTGTAYTVLYSADYVAVAIDTRGTYAGTRRGHSDEECKLRPISDRLLFFSAGLGTASAGGYTFDVGEIARGVYDKAGGNLPISQLGQEWANATSRRLREVLPHAPDLYRGLRGRPVVIDAYFAGNDRDGSLVLLRGDIALAAQSSAAAPSLTVALSRPTVPQGAYENVISDGNRAILREILRGSSARGQALKSQLRSVGEGKTRAERAVEWVTAVTKALIYWSGDQRVGGDVASALVERGKPWRWYRRPAFCPER
jgi:hypothetical protein